MSFVWYMKILLPAYYRSLVQVVILYTISGLHYNTCTAGHTHGQYLTHPPPSTSISFQFKSTMWEKLLKSGTNLTQSNYFFGKETVLVSNSSIKILNFEKKKNVIINKTSSLIKEMAWHRYGAKPFLETMMTKTFESQECPAILSVHRNQHWL